MFKDKNGKELKVGDIIAHKSSLWRIIEKGIEPSTNKAIMVIKNMHNEDIMCGYTNELENFIKIK